MPLTATEYTMNLKLKFRFVPRAGGPGQGVCGAGGAGGERGRQPRELCAVRAAVHKLQRRAPHQVGAHQGV
jgi:hypothetical protein